jgi:hypothetical protein
LQLGITPLYAVGASPRKVSLFIRVIYRVLQKGRGTLNPTQDQRAHHTVFFFLKKTIQCVIDNSYDCQQQQQQQHSLLSQASWGRLTLMIVDFHY